MLPGSTPDITPLQVLVAVQWVVAQAISFGWLHTAPSQVVLSASSTVLAIGLGYAEAHIRHGRALVAAAKVQVEGFQNASAVVPAEAGAPVEAPPVGPGT